MSEGSRFPGLRAGVALIAAAAAASGCTSLSQAAGGGKVAPDEFRVVTKAPLVVPPEYNLRPPRPGEPRPQDLDTSDMARNSLLGDGAYSEASDAERLLVAKAGGSTADPGIRTVIDAENGAVVRKREGFANRVLFFRDGDVADEANPVNPVVEEELLRRRQSAENATGGEDVIIQRGATFKLPGL